MKIISLNGIYKLKLSGEYACDAVVPGSDFGALVNSKKIKNPLNLSSEKEFDSVVKPIYESDATFDGEFFLSEDDIKADNLVLSCEKIDTICTCFVNGKEAFKSSNAYLKVEADIKNLVLPGKNKICFAFESSANYIARMQSKDHLPKNFNGLDGAAHLRKPACHFGWDWGPCVPYNYVGNVEILAFSKRIENISLKRKIEKDVAIVTVFADNVSNKYLVSPLGEKIEFDGDSATVNNPILWYSRDLLGGKNPSLYTLVLENDEEKIEKKIGLRTIELNREPDEYGKNFQFVLNGERVFGKGANLIPFSAIPDFADNKTVDYYLDLAVKSNFNMIRTWGGGEYSSDYLLERCDELGILVWRDFCFACMLYPFYREDFEKSVLEEVEYNVKRMSIHPSLALWCGNNEIEVMFSYMPKVLPLIKAYTKFFYETLPQKLEEIEIDVPYIPSSPLGEKPFEKNTADGVGDTHMWNVWHGLKPLNYYQKRYTRFLSEFGLESLPSMKAIETFAPANQRNLESSAFMSHQKCTGGNAKMLYYLKERFFEPSDFSYLPYMTGIVRAECIRYATEHFRRQKGRCNGSIFWQFNDNWNCPSWSGVDYEGVPKALLYKAKTFFAPIFVSESDGKLLAHNDTLEPIRLDVSITLPDRSYVISELIPKDSVKKLCDLKLKKGEIAKVSWLDHEFVIDNGAKLQTAHFTVKRGEDFLEISSDVYAKNVFVESDAIADNNYFSLLPGEVKRVNFDRKISNYRILCENNLLTKKQPIKRAFERFVYRLQPMNISNYVYYENN